MMGKISTKKWLEELSCAKNILLVNPPVQEVRYAWSKWNQPSDLLVLSSKLKSLGVQNIEILDFMLPDENDRIPFKILNREKVIGKGQYFHSYRLKYYGRQFQEVSPLLIEATSDWKPDHIIITSLTSYWFESIITLVPYFRTIFPDVKISLIGAYPYFESDHALRINVDYIVSDLIEYDETPDFAIYFNNKSKLLNNGKTLTFGGLKYSKTGSLDNIISQIKTLQSLGIKDYVIMEENVFAENSEILTKVLDYVDEEKITARFHGICGINLSKAKEGIFNKMLENGFKSFYFEYELEGNDINIDQYLKMYNELVINSRKKVASGNMAGFVMIGTPNDNLERLFKHTFNILEICGSVIPKPYTPSPFGESADKYKEISARGLEFLSPHVFPLAEHSQIPREDYADFYKHTTFLNGKRMGDSFNFFDQSYTTLALKNSMRKKVGTK